MSVQGPFASQHGVATDPVVGRVMRLSTEMGRLAESVYGGRTERLILKKEKSKDIL